MRECMSQEAPQWLCGNTSIRMTRRWAARPAPQAIILTLGLWDAPLVSSEAHGWEENTDASISEQES